MNFFDRLDNEKPFRFSQKRKKTCPCQNSFDIQLDLFNNQHDDYICIECRIKKGRISSPLRQTQGN